MKRLTMRRLDQDARTFLKGKKPLRKAGNTSLFFPSNRPGYYDTVSIEMVKMDWWRRGLEIIDSYECIGMARYSGIDWYGEHQFNIELGAFWSTVPILDIPDNEQRRRVRAITRMVAEKRQSLVHLIDENGDCYFCLKFWEALQDMSETTCPELAPSVNFIMEWDASIIYPDYGFNDWLVKDGNLVCIDPFHDRYVSQAIHLR